MVGAQPVTTHRYGAVITTVDPTQKLVEGVLKSGSAIRISVLTVGTAFRWPVVGEAWMVRQENGTWYLEGLWPDASFQTVAPGDAIINSPTGTVRVMGSDDGSSDFSFTKTGLPPTGTAGGDLVGTYPNPTVANGAITNVKVANSTLTDAKVAAANKDGTATTPSLRTLGQGAQQTQPGNLHFAEQAMAGRTTAFTFTANTWTPVPMLATVIDPNTRMSGGYYSVAEAGLFQVTGVVHVAASTTPTLIQAGILYYNGTAWAPFLPGAGNVSSAAIATVGASVSAVINAVPASSGLLAIGINSSNTSLTISGLNNWMQVVRLY